MKSGQSNQQDTNSPSSEGVATEKLMIHRQDGLSFFSSMPRLPFERIIDWLPEMDFIRLSLALLKTIDDEQFFLRRVTRENLVHTFLKCVTDAKKNQAKNILMQVMQESSPMFRDAVLERLLISRKSIIQDNGLPIEGNALEIAIKCGDWSCNEQEEMAEMLMPFYKQLPNGEALIRETIQKLFPNGLDALLEEQDERAEKFVQTIIEPLVEVFENASADDIDLIDRGCGACKSMDKLDEYIDNTLANMPLWLKLMNFREVMKEFIQNELIYNPKYLEKTNKMTSSSLFLGKWQYQFDDAEKRWHLLECFGIGGIQACSSLFVAMMHSGGSVQCFFNSNEAKRENFTVLREFRYKLLSICGFGDEIDNPRTGGGADAFHRTPAGRSLIGLVNAGGCEDGDCGNPEISGPLWSRKYTKLRGLVCYYVKIMPPENGKRV